MMNEIRFYMTTKSVGTKNGPEFKHSKYLRTKVAAGGCVVLTKEIAQGADPIPNILRIRSDRHDLLNLLCHRAGGFVVTAAGAGRGRFRLAFLDRRRHFTVLLIRFTIATN